MEYRDLILKHIAEVFGDGEESVVAEKVIDFLAAYSTTKHINLQLVRQLTGEQKNAGFDVVIFRTLQCLSGDKIGLLQTHFELIDVNEEIHDISVNDLNSVKEGVNPITGHEETDIANRVFVYYSPDPAFPARLDRA